MTNLRKTLVLSAIMALSVLGGVANADPSGKWRVVFDHWAEADGERVLRIAPVTGDPIDVTTKIPKGMTENDVATLVTGAIKASVGKAYKVEVDDGEDVIIKKAGKTPKFELTMVSSSVTGLNVKIKRS